jgi:hypothetical protein
MNAPRMPSRTPDKRDLNNLNCPSSFLKEWDGQDHGWLFFRLFASFLILAGAPK